jgi:hypothetical protein
MREPNAHDCALELGQRAVPGGRRGPARSPAASTASSCATSGSGAPPSSSCAATRGGRDTQQPRSEVSETRKGARSLRWRPAGARERVHAGAASEARQVRSSDARRWLCYCASRTSHLAALLEAITLSKSSVMAAAAREMRTQGAQGGRNALADHTAPAYRYGRCNWTCICSEYV